jgi:type IV secretion system protein VirB8
MGIGLTAVVALALAVPLKEVRPYVVMVDRATGESEQVVSVRPTSLADQRAVLEAELVRYVTNRETYDPNDNPERIPLVDAMSLNQAQSSLRAIWNSGSDQYPPALYGDDTVITARVRSVSILDEDTAQVRFVRHMEQEGTNPVERDFVAVVGYRFEPRTERTLDQVWRNPLGFTVTGYRIDAETLDPRG